MSKHLSRILRRKPVLTLVLAATAFATVFAFAASLTVDSQTLGAGNDAVETCDPAVTTAWATSYDASIPGYKVTNVTVADIDGAACNGKSMKVSLTGANDASLAERTVVLGSTASNSAADFSSGNTKIKAADVTGVHVVISG